MGSGQGELVTGVGDDYSCFLGLGHGKDDAHVQPNGARDDLAKEAQ